MKKHSVVPLVILFLATIFLANICQAADKMATLKNIEGNWVVKSPAMEGGTATRYMKFNIVGNNLEVSDWQKGLNPVKTNYDIDRITQNGEELVLGHYLQRVTSPISITISSFGQIKGEGVIGRKKPTPTIFSFSRE